MMAAVARRDKARGEMRAAILDAARAIVSEEGVHALSMRAIARRLGYSPAALYEYFPAKEDVCRALYFEGASGLAGRMRAVLNTPGDQAGSHGRLWEIGHAYRRYALEQPDLYLLAFGSVSADFTPVAAELDAAQEAFSLLIDAARAGIEDGTFAPMPAEAIALACWSTVHGFVTFEIGGLIEHKLAHAAPADAPVDTDTLFNAVLRVLGEGFLRR